MTSVNEDLLNEIKEVVAANGDSILAEVYTSVTKKPVISTEEMVNVLKAMDRTSALGYDSGYTLLTEGPGFNERFSGMKLEPIGVRELAEVDSSLYSALSVQSTVIKSAAARVIINYLNVHFNFNRKMNVFASHNWLD